MCVSCIGGEGRLYLYALPSGDFLHSFKGIQSAGQFTSYSRAHVCFAPSTGNLLLAERSGDHHATEYTVRGAFVRALNLPDSAAARPFSFGIAATEALVATSSADPPAVHLFRYADAALLRTLKPSCASVGEGSYLNSFPPGLRFSPDGEHLLVVHYTLDGPLSVFTAAGDHIKSTCWPAFNNPYDVDFASNGDVIVASWCGHTVSVLSSISGGFSLLRTFGGQSPGPGGFSSPAALAVASGKLYVMDYKRPHVQVFE